METTPGRVAYCDALIVPAFRRFDVSVSLLLLLLLLLLELLLVVAMVIIHNFRIVCGLARVAWEDGLENLSRSQCQQSSTPKINPI